MKLYPTILFFLVINIYPQIREMTNIDYTDLIREFNFETSLDDPHEETSISLKIINDNTKLSAFFYTKIGFIKLESTNNGDTWQRAKLIHELEGARRPNIRYSFDVSLNSDGSYLIFAQPFEDGIITRLGPLAVWKFTSDDQLLFRTDLPVFRKTDFDLCRVTDNKYFLSYSDSGTYIYKSDDGGLSWKEFEFLENVNNLSIEYSSSSNSLLGTYVNHVDVGKYELNFYEMKLNDYSWTSPKIIYSSSAKIYNPEIVITGDSKFWIVYNENSIYDQKYTRTNIAYITSADEGITWDAPANFTHYYGSDILLNISDDNKYPLVTYFSNRKNNQKKSFYLGSAGYSNENAPPFFAEIFNAGLNEENGNYIFRAKVYHYEKIKNVFLQKDLINLPLYDDGKHNDSLANDNIWGNEISRTSELISGNSVLVDVNNFKLPILNNGILAAARPGVTVTYNATDVSGHSMDLQNFQYFGSLNGLYLNKNILFSSGFFLGGYANSKLWVNAAASAMLVEDYLPGTIGSEPKEAKNIVYVVTKDDPPFGNAWQNWKYAVEQGAYFYDGDGNGYYDPIDHNGNGIWEPNEDRPDILYDATYFTVYNDGLPRNLRRWNTVDPLGIEIRQTVFASGTVSELQDVIFIRYSILYKGLDDMNEPDTLTDVIFSIWSDADLGDHADDRIGCDTTLQSGFYYNNGKDYIWGDTPPTFFTTFLQGPQVKTNLLNSFAYNRKGQAIGIDSVEGFTNGEMAAFTGYLSGDTYMRDPSTAIEARYNMSGLNIQGNTLTPCDFVYSYIGGGADCESINPYKWYSGDPVIDYGWIYKIVADQRNLTSSEKFDLVKNQPVDIIVAYTVGMGTDHLSSITDGRNKVRNVFDIYKNNFPGSFEMPDYNEIYPKEFHLSQNYPNPFNPTTKIKFSIPSPTSPLSKGGMQGGLTNVSLIVYDILGRKVTTLVNEPKAPGNYEITFNASQLASGVYLYRLTSGLFSQTKKMIVLK